MPRTNIKIQETIEYLSILDENAKMDKALEPKLSPEQLKTMYKYMLLGRRTDERMLLMQRQGRMGTFPQSTGHEAVSMGAALAITQSDWHVPAYREAAGMLYRGWTVEHLMLYWGGYEEGASPPAHVNDLPMCIPVGTQLLHAVGLGMAANIVGDKKVVLTFFGDGAASEGDFHEALNFASVFSAPVVFVCQNNQYAISVPLSKQMKAETLAQRAVAYGMPGIRVDGNDALAVYVATSEAVERARKGGGPTLIEGLTYRTTPHTTADDPKRYRSEAEQSAWAKREPLLRFKKYLEEKKILSPQENTKLEEEVDTQIKAAVESFTEMTRSEKLTNPLAMFDYLYAEMPAFLQEQKEEFADYLKTKGQK